MSRTLVHPVGREHFVLRFLNRRPKAALTARTRQLEIFSLSFPLLLLVAQVRAIRYIIRKRYVPAQVSTIALSCRSPGTSIHRPQSSPTRSQLSPKVPFLRALPIPKKKKAPVCDLHTGYLTVTTEFCDYRGGETTTGGSFSSFLVSLASVSTLSLDTKFLLRPPRGRLSPRDKISAVSLCYFLPGKSEIEKKKKRTRQPSQTPFKKLIQLGPCCFLSLRWMLILYSGNQERNVGLMSFLDKRTTAGTRHRRPIVIRDTCTPSKGSPFLQKREKT